MREARRAVQTVEVRDKVLKAFVEDLKHVVQIMSRGFFSAAKATEALWRKTLSAVEATHAAE